MVLEYDKIVVGSCMSAVLFAFNNNYPIFFTTPFRPFRFSYFDSTVNFDCLKIISTVKSLTTLDGQNEVGVPKELLWERLLFLLSLDGKVPLSNLCHNIRYDGERMVCSNDYSKIMEVKFNNCYYFGDTGTTGFVRQKSLDEDNYICYDYIAFNSGGKHAVDFIHTGDDFISEIWFYSSDRIDGNTPVRDACAVSKLTGSQLMEFDHSETMARFKVIHEMETRGMKGTFAHDYTTAGNPKHYKFRTTSIRRETYKQRNREEPQSKSVEVAQYCEKSLLQDLPQGCMVYNRFLRDM